LVKNAQYQGWSKAIVSGGFVSEKARIPDSPSFTLRTPMHSKAVVTGLSDTSGGAFIRNEDSGVYQPLGYVPSTLRELVQVRQTQTDAVDYVSQTTKITQAAAVAEATSAAAPTVVTTATGEPLVYTSTVTPNAGGGYKPEGALTFARVSAAVETIAAWLPVTKRAMADAAQLRGIINQELREALDEKLEYQMFEGSGSSPELVGVKNTSGILTQAFGTDLLTTSRKAITNLVTNGNEYPTAFVLSPADWEGLELALFAAAPYLPYQKTLWRVPVVEYYGLTAKTGYLANWRKAVLWDREQASISISDSHADFFIRNLLAVLGEVRAAFGIIKPKAFVKIATAAA
jgi:HK97 family phage major capsid protein